MSHREIALEKALRDLLMERSTYTERAARSVLGLCQICSRDTSDPCGACADGIAERFADRERIYDCED